MQCRRVTNIKWIPKPSKFPYSRYPLKKEWDLIRLIKWIPKTVKFSHCRYPLNTKIKQHLSVILTNKRT
jgi:hypothetical protein